MVQEVSYSPRRELRAQARHARPAWGGRARHSSGNGDGFVRLLAWTTVGAIAPGLGYLVSGRRRLGAVVLAVAVLAVAVLAALVATGRLLDLGLQVAVRPTALAVAAGLLVVVGLAWAVVIITGHWSLRRARLRRRHLTGGQQLLALVLLTALVAAVVLPTATGARYALAQRSLLLNVFDDDGEPREPGLAAPDTAASDPWAGTPRINVLLLGSDAGKGRDGTRPDTIITASIDTATGDAVLFSLPRNLERTPFPPGTPGNREFPDGFYCPGSTECLINGIWTWAESRPDLFPGDPEPGLTATRQAVSETLGLNIDYYALVNLAGFTDVVNAMGGVELQVNSRIPIGGGTSRIKGYIEPGLQRLDGYRALWFARSREGSTDYDRMGRQRCVLAAAVNQADPKTLARAFPQIAASAERNVETDIPADELDAFVDLGMRVQSGSLRSLPFTNDVITSSDPDFAAIRALVRTAIEPPPPPPAPSTPAEPAPTDTATEPAETPAVDPGAAQDVDAVC